MIDLKKCNYITGDPQCVSYGVSKILKFFELEGKTILLLTPSRQTTSTSLKYLFNNKAEYSDYDSFKSILEDKGRLFRVDLIVADLWQLRNVGEYTNLLYKLGIDHIVMARQYHYKDTDSVNDYHITRESSGVSDKYTINDYISKWSADIDSLIKSYIRDKRIDGIIGDQDFI